MKDFAKQLSKLNKRKSMGPATRMILGLGLISATGLATKIILTPKSQKIIASTVSKDAKDAFENVVDKSDEVKRVIVRGYRNINRDLHKIAKKISNEIE